MGPIKTREPLQVGPLVAATGPQGRHSITAAQEDPPAAGALNGEEKGAERVNQRSNYMVSPVGPPPAVANPPGGAYTAGRGTHRTRKTTGPKSAESETLPVMEEVGGSTTDQFLKFGDSNITNRAVPESLSALSGRRARKRPVLRRSPRFPQPKNKQDVSGLVVRDGGHRPPEETRERRGHNKRSPTTEDQARPTFDNRARR